MSQAPRGSGELQREAARILDERARELARPGDVDLGAATGTLVVVRFLLRGAAHAVATVHVREIVHPGPLTPVPGAPPLLVGVVNLRGVLVPVFDLAALLGGAVASEPASHPLVLVLGNGGPDLAVSVDDALDVVSLPIATLAPAATGAASGPGALVLGLAPDRTIVLDGAALLADPRLFAAEGPPDAPNAAPTRREA